jgi:hypothetical protein
LVLRTATAGGAGRRRAPRCTAEDGAQSIEFALTIPFAVLTIALLLHAALFGADLVAANAVALQAARMASTSTDADVRAAVGEAAGGRPVEVTVDPPDGRRDVGDLVRATVRVRSAAFAAFGATVWVPARATLQVERT